MEVIDLGDARRAIGRIRGACGRVGIRVARVLGKGCDPARVSIERNRPTAITRGSRLVTDTRKRLTGPLGWGNIPNVKSCARPGLPRRAFSCVPKGRNRRG